MPRRCQTTILGTVFPNLVVLYGSMELENPVPGPQTELSHTKKKK
jgi:hypothetical protein